MPTFLVVPTGVYNRLQPRKVNSVVTVVKLDFADQTAMRRSRFARLFTLSRSAKPVLFGAR